MSLPRIPLHAVLPPNHTVFIRGGALSRENRMNARLQSEIHDPATNASRAVGAYPPAGTVTVVSVARTTATLTVVAPCASAGKMAASRN